MVTSHRDDRTQAGHAKWLAHARDHLRSTDPVLARVIADRPDFDPRRWLRELPPMDLFGALVFQVVGQQLSVAATRRSSPASRRASAASSRRRPRYWTPIRRSSATLACPGAKSAHCGISPSACRMGGSTRRYWPRCPTTS